jgi:uncharacterized alpha-E superfamily protein
MLARVAEGLYWMTRYLERAENTARMINATSQMLLDLPRGASFGWDVLLKVAGLDQVFHETYPAYDEASIMRFLIGDNRNPSSITSCIERARENSRTLREILPRAAWERINSLYLYVREHSDAALERANRYNILEQIIERRQSVVGMLSENMSHGVAYQFIRLGRNIERADMTTRIVDITSAVLLPRQQASEDPAMNLLWMGVLKALNAYQMYRRHVSVHVRGTDVVSYLLKDELFPRTVHYSLQEIRSALDSIPDSAVPKALLESARIRVSATRVESLSDGERHEYLDAVQADIAALDRAIGAQFFERYAEKA